LPTEKPPPNARWKRSPVFESPDVRDDFLTLKPAAADADGFIREIQIPQCREDVAEIFVGLEHYNIVGLFYGFSQRLSSLGAGENQQGFFAFAKRRRQP
jgi:hypothetical protein